MNLNENEHVHHGGDQGLAAARLKLKQQQKDFSSRSSNGSSSDVVSHDDNGNVANNYNYYTQQQQQQQQYYPANSSYYPTTAGDQAYLMAANQQQQQYQQSGRSTPSSSSTFYNNGAAAASSYHHQSSPPFQQQAGSPQGSATSPPTSFPSMISNLDAAVSVANMNPAAFKEQLQLHVQTIGILVAEKAEMQSKLHQATKKCDKKQDECDELMGRLKASRQKISDLEKQVQQNLAGSSSASESTNAAAASSGEIEFLKSELNSKHLLIDELKIRQSESSERIAQKQQENQRLSQLCLELKSQLELLQMKLTQFNNDNTNGTSKESTASRQNGGHVDQSAAEQELSRSNRLVEELRESNATLEAKLKDAREQLGQQKDELKVEYQSYVDQFQRQIESLVDQINRMSDEREDSFSKLDRLDQLVKSKDEAIKARDAEVQELKSKLAQQEAEVRAAKAGPSAVTSTGQASSDKAQLLENEIKYFKQQIEILVQEQAQMAQVIQDKEMSIGNLNKLVEKFESDREQHAKLLETLHNEKQTLSRAIHQNKELKEQLTELQDAFVNVTQKNLELTTQLQAEQFKLKQINESPNSFSIQQVQQVQLGASQQPAAPVHESSTPPEDADEWNSDEDPQNSSSPDRKSESSLMQGIKERIEYLEKENKDLNDYIELMNKRAAAIDQQVASQQPNDLEPHQILHETIRKLTSERDDLARQVKAVREQSLAQSQETAASLDNPVVDQEFIKDMKLLEDKFNKVMVENVELREKNQELEHTIDQLQFETETIADYISMYQVQREKLAQKYKDSLKDESIRSLSTQLQVNRLALGELSSYFSTLLKYVDNSSIKQQEVVEGQEPPAAGEPSGAQGQANDAVDSSSKREFLVNQISSLLVELTENSSRTLNQVSANQQNLIAASKPAAVVGAKKAAQSRGGHGHGHSHDHHSSHHGHSHDDHDDHDDHHHGNHDDEGLEGYSDASMAAFRSHLVLCNNCQGELFIV